MGLSMCSWSLAGRGRKCMGGVNAYIDVAYESCRGGGGVFILYGLTLPIMKQK
jgi:hypothetical protein